LRHLQALALTPAPALAVVSANAFDRSLDNDIGLPAQDFLVKPVRRQELLQWLQHKLQLRWRLHTAAVPPSGLPDSPGPSDTVSPTPPPAPPGMRPDALPEVARAQLLELARLGYYRGFAKQVQRLQDRHPDLAHWLGQLQARAREFQFEAILAELDTRQPPTPAPANLDTR